jgi:cation diffusion facilitator family transporter
MGSLGTIWIGRILFPGMDLHWLDPAAAVAVALLIVHAAWKLTIRSAGDLMDANLPPAEERRIRDIIESRKDIVKGYHHLRSRRSGTTRFIDFHIKVDPRMTVERSHQAGEEISDAIRLLFAGANVTVHVEPCDGRCKKRCIAGCLLGAEERLKTRATRERKNA